MAIKKKTSAKKSKMPAELLERFKSKAAKAKTGVAKAREERAAKRAERMGNKADSLNTKKSERDLAKDKLDAARKAKKATAPKKKVVNTKSKTTKATTSIKHVGQERTADGKVKPKSPKDEIITVRHTQPSDPGGYSKYLGDKMKSKKKK